MDDIGHLYVLANSAMPGLVKVGKTTRSPAERAVELSSATGLPTPFIVVYEQLFSNCSEAESFVHSYLATKGFRISDKREFFNAPVNTVVRAIALAPGAMDTIEFIPKRESNVGDELGLGTPRLDNHVPWASVFKEAEDHYFGHNQTLQDDKRALRLYLQATKLGSLPAYSRIASMYLDGRGAKVDEGIAIQCLKDGAQKGSSYCYWQLAMLSLDSNSRASRYLENSDKYFSIFLEINSKYVDSSFCTNDQWLRIDLDCVGFISKLHRYHTEPPSVVRKFLLLRSKSIRELAMKMFDESCKKNMRDDMRFYNAVLEHIPPELSRP